LDHCKSIFAVIVTGRHWESYVEARMTGQAH